MTTFQTPSQDCVENNVPSPSVSTEPPGISTVHVQEEEREDLYLKNVPQPTLEKMKLICSFCSSTVFRGCTSNYWFNKCVFKNFLQKVQDPE